MPSPPWRLLINHEIEQRSPCYDTQIHYSFVHTVFTKNAHISLKLIANLYFPPPSLYHKAFTSSHSTVDRRPNTAERRTSHRYLHLRRSNIHRALADNEHETAINTRESADSFLRIDVDVGDAQSSVCARRSVFALLTQIGGNDSVSCQSE